ncbi:hypothetical protein L914_11863, partial [Phytophthora nicotianae]
INVFAHPGKAKRREGEDRVLCRSVEDETASDREEGPPILPSDRETQAPAALAYRLNKPWTLPY